MIHQLDPQAESAVFTMAILVAIAWAVIAAYEFIQQRRGENGRKEHITYEE